jgi:predicted dinucleotide-binding enzyme
MRSWTAVFLLVNLLACSFVSSVEGAETVAVIGTGDMGNSLGPKLAEIGYLVIYGSRDPSREKVQELVKNTAPNATAKTQKEAAQSADIVVLAVPWPAMEQVAQNLGDLDGKIVIDVSFPYEQGPDGYPQSTVETSSAEMIQAWNPDAKVVKWSLPTAHYIDKPQELGHRPSNLIAADDRNSKETVARIAYAIGQDPFDAGPLRMSRAVEAQALLFIVPLYQRRNAHWETITVRSSYWSCFWGDDWSSPVIDSDDLAEFPEDDQPLKQCSEYPSDR